MEGNDFFYWLDWSWFTDFFANDSGDQKYTFVRPYLLTLIYFTPLIPFIRFIWSYFLGGKFKIAQINTKRSFDPTIGLALIPSILFSLSLSCLLMALSGPQRTNEKIEQWTEGIDIMIAIDISWSMRGMDLKPDRLEAAKEMAINFIDGRTDDRIGVVIFRGEAYSKSPITSDYDLLKKQIKEIEYEDIQTQGTAIGPALATAVSRMKDSDADSKVVILLSDGQQTKGNIDPATAAKLAYSFDIKVYPIGIGKKGKVPYMQEYITQNPFTGKTSTHKELTYQENTFDEKELKGIAKTTNGKYFRATNNTGLASIFKDIDELEKSEIKEDRFKSTKDFYQPYLIWGVIFLLAWLFTKSTFLTSALHD